MNEQVVHFPQDEINNLFLPVTQGCSYNRCIFCTMYKDQSFEELPLRELELILKSADPYTEKVFLTGGDPLALGYEKVKTILELIRSYLPYCAQVASYASVLNISKYSQSQLESLHNSGLRMLYIGFESGNDRALSFMKKSHRLAQALEESKKLNAARLSFSSIILLGLGGAKEARKNALASAAMLNSFESRKLITMKLGIFQGSEIRSLVDRGGFLPASSREILEEMMVLVDHLEPKRPLIFDSSHPTNIFKIKAKLPEDRATVLRRLKYRIEEM